MVDRVVSGSALLSELASAYERCNRTADTLAQLLSTRDCIQQQQQEQQEQQKQKQEQQEQQTEQDELSVSESAEVAALGAELQDADATVRQEPSASQAAAASSSSPASGTASVPPFRCRTSASKREVLSLACCDLTLTNLSSGPEGFERVMDEFSSPAPSAGGSSPATTATGNSRSVWYLPLSPNHHQQQQQLELSRRASVGPLPPSLRNSWASQPQAAPHLHSTPPPILLRERLLQRYDSNPGTCYQSYGDDPLLSTTVPEALAWRLGERDPSPRVAGGDGAGGIRCIGPQPSHSGRFLRSQSGALPASTRMWTHVSSESDGRIGDGFGWDAVASPRSPSSGGGGGASGRTSGSGTPLVPTPPPPAGRAPGRGLAFIRSRRSLAGNAGGMALLRLGSDNGRSSSRQSSGGGIAIANLRSSLGTPTGSAAASTFSAVASGGIGVCDGGGDGCHSGGHSSPQLQLLHPVDAGGPLALLLPAATANPGLPAMPAPRRSFQGSASGLGRDAFLRSSTRRFSTSEWLQPSRGSGGGSGSAPTTDVA